MDNDKPDGPVDTLRRSIRIPGFDYSQPGSYFVTISTQNKRCLFGSVIDHQMFQNKAGLVIRESWLWLSRRYSSFLTLDSWVIMPNHIHGILVITKSDPKSQPLGNLICAFKNISRTKLCSERLLDPNERLWQRNYFEHVIRNEQDLYRIRQYILDNPTQWAVDRENPQRDGDYGHDN